MEISSDGLRRQKTMISDQRRRLQIICSLVIFFTVVAMCFGGASYSSAHADELLRVQAAPSASPDAYHSLGDTGHLTVILEAGEYEINQVGEYSVIEMDGFGSITNPGEPKLPYKTFLIALPPGAEATSVDVVASDYAEIQGEYRIMPAPPIISGQEDEVVRWGENEEVYSLAGAYPSSSYEYLGMAQMRKYGFARVGFCPIAYYPASNKLGSYRSITLEINYEIIQVMPPELLADTVMDDTASQILVNYHSIKSRYQSAVVRSPVPYSYVIITTDSLQSDVQPLVTWKTAAGYSVNVVTISWISVNYAGIDLPEKIRNFLIDKYAEWGIEYVLIVGSHSTIPMRYCYPKSGDHDPNSDSTTPTDYYYADLTGNWDSDGDGYFGEYGQDDVDFYPEVYVGRIPVDSGAIVTSICQKSASFEQDGGSWKKKALLLGAIMQYDNEYHTGCPKTDGAVVMEECWNDILSGNGYSRERMYETNGLAPSTYAYDHPLTNSNVLNPSYGWASGYGIVNWHAHGGPTSTARWVWEWDDGDGVPESNEMEWHNFISSGDAISLDDNKPAVVFSDSCLTACPEDANNLGKSLLQQGAVAFVGATRSSSGTAGWQNEGDGGSDSIDYYFFHYLINQGRKCGDALYDSDDYYLDHFTGGAWASWGWAHWQNMFGFCLYGDPSLSMATTAGLPDITVSPPTFDVTLPPDTIQNYSLTMGNVGDATLTYSFSDRQTVGGTSQGDKAEMSIQPDRKVLETPPKSTLIEPGDAIKAQGSWQNIMTENFEGSFPGIWNVYCEQGSTDARWGKDNYNPHGGSYGAFCAKDGTAGVAPPSDYPNNMLAVMEYGPFSLADAADAEVSFYWWVDSQVLHDYLYCLAYVDKNNSEILDRTGDSGGWESQSLDLGRFCGQPAVYLAFAFKSDAAGTDKGAFIDDVVLRKYADVVNNPPNVPSNPSPANHATGIATSADLSWTGGDPDAGDVVTYDVYFGTSASPPLVLNNQWVTTYDPGTLADDTRYYWKIVATDNHGASTTGPVWDFTTGGVVEDCPWLDENPKSGSVPAGGTNSITVTINTAGLTVGNTYTAEIVIANNDPDENPKVVSVTLLIDSGVNKPPNMPSNPSPANHATGIPINACLGWTGGDPDPGDTVTYDVYFGTNPGVPPLVGIDISEPTYCPGPLACDTKYYWYVVATDNHGASTTVPSPWDFTTSPNGHPDITVFPTSFDVALRPDTTRDYTLTIGNDGGATLTYSIIDKETMGGVGVAGGESLFSMEPASILLEVPLECEPVQPQNTGLATTGWQNIMSEDFEGAFPTGSWAAYDGDGVTDGEYYWDEDDYKPHWGSRSAWCANGGADGLDPEFYYYPHDMESWMAYGPFDLGDATGAELNFYCWLDTELDYDYLHWMASIDGDDFHGWKWSGNSGGWVSESFDLADVPTLGNLCGQSQVWIAFIFTSDEDITGDGAFVDDVVLRKYVSAVNNPPNTPSNPSPSNHATSIPTSADLSWSGGDPDAGDVVTYDVYFGTSTTPPLVRNDQLGTTYDPGTLSFDTRYYWKIVATDSHGASVEGAIWDFATGLGANNPPNTPSSPSPANHAAGISTNADLSWIGGDPDAGDTVTYDVYFGTSTVPPLVSDDQSGTTYDLGTLNIKTKYYWKVVARDNHGASAAGPLWDFTTGGPSGDCAWLDENSRSGSVPAGGSNDITVTINTVGLTVGGTYTADIVITSNDPDENPKVVPVTLRVREPGPAVNWNLPWGLDADPASVNIWTYPGDAVSVTLADVDWSMPSGLLIWYYGGPSEGWRFYKKGWGAANTLETLIPGKGYIGIVPTAGVWEIPQG
jgi:hypothetical protein